MKKKKTKNIINLTQKLDRMLPSPSNPATKSISAKKPPNTSIKNTNLKIQKNTFFRL